MPPSAPSSPPLPNIADRPLNPPSLRICDRATRTVWHRRLVMEGRTGALDLPGTTWRDRPAIDRGDGVWLAGDWVASPGHLAEVSATSAVTAARAAVSAASQARTRAGSPDPAGTASPG